MFGKLFGAGPRKSVDRGLDSLGFGGFDDDDSFGLSESDGDDYFKSMEKTYFEDVDAKRRKLDESSGSEGDDEWDELDDSYEEDD